MQRSGPPAAQMHRSAADVQAVVVGWGGGKVKEISEEINAGKKESRRKLMKAERRASLPMPHGMGREENGGVRGFCTSIEEIDLDRWATRMSCALGRGTPKESQAGHSCTC